MITPQKSFSSRTCLLLAIFTWSVTPVEATEPTEAWSVWEGVYTESQATRGKVVFDRQCSVCHSAKQGETAGDGTVPSLIGEDFSYRWEDSSMAYLMDTIRQTMPEAAPNSLSSQEYAAVTAYLLKLNQYPAGGVELDFANRKDLEQIFIRQSVQETPQGGSRHR